MIYKVINLIKQGFLSIAGKDNGEFPLGQASYNDTDSDFVRLSTYGICANPPKDSHVLLFNSRASESNKFGIVNDFTNRKKDLEEGEVALYNSKTKTIIILKEDGSIGIRNGKTSIEIDTLIDDLFTELKTITTAGSPVAQAVDAATGVRMDTLKEKFKQLFGSV